MDYIVNTPCGMLQGCYNGNPGIAAYKGIRYAQPVVGNIPLG